MLCANLKGWDEVGGGRQVQEGGDMYIYGGDGCIVTLWSHYRIAETNTTL